MLAKVQWVWSKYIAEIQLLEPCTEAMKVTIPGDSSFKIILKTCILKTLKTKLRSDPVVTVAVIFNLKGR